MKGQWSTEILMEDSWTEEDFQIWKEELQYYQENPMSLQQTDVQLLASHPLLTFQQAVNLAYYIDRSGYILDWGELGNIQGFTETWIINSKPYFTLDFPSKGPRFIPQSIQTGVKWGNSIRFPFSEGIVHGEYLGLPFRDFGSLSIKANPYRFEIRWDRDIGEPYSKKLFDHWSGFLSWKPQSSLYIHLGNYALGFGSGLLVGNSFGSGRIRSALQIHKKVSMSRPSASFSEFDRWTGLLLEYHLSHWKFQFATGHQYLDAKIEHDTLRMLYSSGLHRTTTERERKHSARAWNHFASVEYGNSFLQIAQGFQWIQIKDPLQKPIGGTSLHLQTLLENIQLEGEVSIDFQGKFASIISVSSNFEQNHIGLQYGHVGKKYETALFRKPRLLFSGNQNLEIQAFWSHQSQRSQTSVLLYFGKIQKGVEWASVRRGWEFQWDANFTQFNFSGLFRSEINANQSFYLNQKVNLPSYSNFSFQYIAHGTNIHELAQTFVLQRELVIRSTQWLFQLFAHNDNMSGLPTWIYAPSTSMQMGMFTLRGNGWGMNVKGTAHIGTRHKLETTFRYQKLFNISKIGSGLDSRNGSHVWSFALEYHLKLGKY